MKSFYTKLNPIVLISFLGILVYSNTFHCSFHLDDHPSIIDNFAIRDIHHLKNIWDFLPRRFILYLSLALNYNFHQLDVFGYHLVNLAIHLISAVLVWWLVLLTLSTPVMKDNKIARHADLIALFTGLIFVSHPVQTQAVTYIVQRAASMATLFYVASLCFYVKSKLLQDGGSTSGLWKFYYIGSLLTAIVAMFTKEIVITLPLMILFYEFSFLKTKKSFNWGYVVPFLLTIFIIPLTMYFTESVKAQHMRGVVAEGPTNISCPNYLLTQFRVMATYIRLVFLPFNQNLYYDYPVSKNIFESSVLISFLFLIVIFFSAKRLFLKYRLVSFSIFWFFSTLLPESSFLPIKDVIFEHRLYLPLVGYSMFLVSGVYYFLGMNNLKIMIKVLVMIVACYSILTYQRNKVWRDEFTLWGDVVQKSPRAVRAYNGLGVFYGGQGNFTQALSYFNKAIEINPNYGEAYINRGTIYARQGNFTYAMFDFNKAIEIDPNVAGYYYDRGTVDNIAQAMSDYNKAIEINPDYTEAYYNRSASYYKLKEYDKAWGDVHKVEGLGGSINPAFLNALKGASGRDE